MPMGHVLTFAGVGIEKYDAVQKELGWEGEKGKPAGLLAHAAGTTEQGFLVTEWWESEEAWTTFFSSALQPALERVGGFPQPDVTKFEVHWRYPS